MNFKLVFAVACAQVALLVGAAPEPEPKPYDPIPYEVLNKTGDFEIRRYPSFQYAESSEPGSEMVEAHIQNSMRLDFYFNGNNEKKEKIQMTVPEFSPLQKDQTGGYIQNYKLMYWLPQKYQCPDCPPKPSSEDVRITVWGEKITYVRTFDWWWQDVSLIKSNEKKLRESLDAAGVKAGVDYDPGMVLVAFYFSPINYWRLYTEVMFMQTRKSNDATMHMKMET